MDGIFLSRFPDSLEFRNAFYLILFKDFSTDAVHPPVIQLGLAKVFENWRYKLLGYFLTVLGNGQGINLTGGFNFRELSLDLTDPVVIVCDIQGKFPVNDLQDLQKLIALCSQIVNVTYKSETITREFRVAEVHEYDLSAIRFLKQEARRFGVFVEGIQEWLSKARPIGTEEILEDIQAAIGYQ